MTSFFADYGAWNFFIACLSDYINEIYGKLMAILEYSRWKKETDMLLSASGEPKNTSLYQPALYGFNLPINTILLAYFAYFYQ